MMETPLVTLVVLNWNRKDLLSECLESLRRTDYPNIEFMVVDNGSTDGSIEMVEQMSWVVLVKNKENLGYTGGNNAGFAAAKGKYVVTVNNDIAVEPSWLRDPIRYLESDSRLGLVCCRQMNYYDRSLVDSLFLCPSRFLIPERVGHGKPYLSNDPLHSEAGYVLAANGASAIYRRKMLDDIGGLEESFFIYHEECDLHYRAFLRGWKCLYVPGAVVYHKDNETMRNRKSSFYYMHERNRIWFIYRNIPAGIILRNLPIVLLRELRTAMRVAVLSRQPLVYLRARVDGFMGMRRFYHTRRRNTVAFRQFREDYAYLCKWKKRPYSVG